MVFAHSTGVGGSAAAAGVAMGHSAAMLNAIGTRNRRVDMDAPPPLSYPRRSIHRREITVNAGAASIADAGGAFCRRSDQSTVGLGDPIPSDDGLVHLDAEAGPVGRA